MITRVDNKNNVADSEEKPSDEGINYEDISIYLVETNE